MENKEKRIITGFKTLGTKLKGNIKKIVNTVIALLLSLGMVVGAGQAMKLYNEWVQTGRLDSLAAITMMNNEKQKDNNFTQENLKDFQNIAKEYQEAYKKGDKAKLDELDKLVEDKGYFELIKKDVTSTILEKLGYDEEAYTLVYGRDGIFVADKSKMEDKILFSSNGTVSNSVKVVNADGKHVRVTGDMAKVYEEFAKTLSSKETKGVLTTSNYYSKLVQLQENQLENDKSIVERE